MIYELRIYTCRPGTMEKVLDMWQREGRALIEPHMKMAGQWTSASGVANRIYTIWEFRDLADRERSRAALLADPSFAEYLARCRDCYVEQEAIFLSPTPLSPMA